MVTERIKMRILQDDVLDEVRKELDRQFAKWGVQVRTSREWCVIELEEIGEVAHASLEGKYEEAREEWIHVAAVAIAAIASIDYER